MILPLYTKFTLRPRQEVFVERSLGKLRDHNNTIGIATVGFGKTICIAAVCATYRSSLVVQHRIELLDQNRDKFQRFSPNTHTATFAGDFKRWANEGHTFAMMQTLALALESMEPVDLLVIDECHHAEAASYQAIVARAKELNPAVHVFGVTATPERGDGKSLRAIFSNVADIVSLKEMIEAGFLVRPVTYIIDVGMESALGELKKGKNEFNMDAAAELMNVEPVTERVVEEWHRLAADRRTIGFATNVAHSKRMVEAFVKIGVAAEHVDGTTPKGLRKRIWKRLRTGETQMVWNVGVATEGFDEPSVSCVILDRPAMHRSTMVQMIGRGLRILSEPENYPGVVKNDCIVLDFGASLSTHKTLEVDADIDGSKGKGGEAPMKPCPKCQSEIPMGVRTCPLCGYKFLTLDKDGRTLIGDFVMIEVDFMSMSPFSWQPLWNGEVVIAEALTAAAIIVYYQETWWAYGTVRGNRNVQMLVASPDKVMTLAKGNEFLKQYGDKDAARKSKRWLTEPLSDKQADLLGVERHNPGIFGGLAVKRSGTQFSLFQAAGVMKNRYQACCELTWKFNEQAIKASIFAQTGK